MKERALKFLVCPSCQSELSLGPEKQIALMGEVRSGILICIGCHAEYPIRNYIPRFVSSENYAKSFGLEWNQHARTQLDKFSGLNLTEERFRRSTGWPDCLRGQRILEA